jgi:hypothetical protein
VVDPTDLFLDPQFCNPVGLDFSLAETRPMRREQPVRTGRRAGTGVWSDISQVRIVGADQADVSMKGDAMKRLSFGCTVTVS